jgi:hypothetical protein
MIVTTYLGPRAHVAVLAREGLTFKRRCNIYIHLLTSSELPRHSAARDIRAHRTHATHAHKARFGTVVRSRRGAFAHKRAGVGVN